MQRVLSTSRLHIICPIYKKSLKIKISSPCLLSTELVRLTSFSSFRFKCLQRLKIKSNTSPNSLYTEPSRSSTNILNGINILDNTKFLRANFCTSSVRHNNRNAISDKSKSSTLYYIIAIGILAVGVSYAAVPLYRIFCQAYSYGGTTQQDNDSSKVENLVKRDDIELTVRFNADTAASMVWNFKPQQSEVKVIPGETALAFYTARNPTDRQVIGISTYNVVPFDAGQYFNKIQCFCFEEQMLNPHEEVSMPVFFYIDPEFGEDPKMEYVREITLSYTFFEVKEGMKLPLPGFANR